MQLSNVESATSDSQNNNAVEASLYIYKSLNHKVSLWAIYDALYPRRIKQTS